MNRMPKLRFKEFNIKWEEKKLGDITKFSKGKLISKEDITETGIECIRYGELYTTYGEVITKIVSKTNLNVKDLVLSEENDIIIPSSGETAIDIAKASCVTKSGVALSGDLNILKLNENGIFLSYYLNNKLKYQIASLAQGASVVHLYENHLKKLKVLFPSLKEQQKIADFLSSIDKKISITEEKLDLFKEYKKGIMQKIFNQELKFKDNNGNDYPEWEEKSFKDILIERKDIATDNEELYSLTIEKGVTPKEERYERDFLVNDEKEAYKIVLKNDFVYNPMNIRFGAVAQFIENKPVKVSKYYNIFYSNDYVNSYFFEKFIKTKRMFDLYNKLATGSLNEKKRLHFTDFLEIKQSFPCLEEQQKIANFLSSIDNKIDSLATELEDLKEFKKGLLQQMFV